MASSDSGGSLWMGLAGSWIGSAGLTKSFSFFVFYLIYRGRHLNSLSKSLIYCDLSV